LVARGWALIADHSAPKIAPERLRPSEDESKICAY